jgi:hypothetical protein
MSEKGGRSQIEMARPVSGGGNPRIDGASLLRL